MGNKFMHKMIAVFVAAAMILTCSIGVCAGSGSPTAGKVNSVVSDSKGTTSMTITWTVDKAADSYIVKVGSQTYKDVKGTSLTVTTKTNAKYTVSVTPVTKGKAGTEVKGANRWMKKTKITKAKAGKKKVTLTWKKVKGAKKYQVQMLKNGKWVTVKTTKSTKATVKAKKGKHKFRVVPVKGSYIGVTSNVKTGKAK